MRKVRVAAKMAVGALDTLDVIDGAITGAANDTYRLISAKLAYQLVDLAALIDDGQEFGLSHSDYTAAEVEECLEAQTSIDLGDKVAQERANRLVRSLGRFSGDAVTVSQSLAYNQGRPVKTKLNWKMSIGDTLNVWVRNSSGVIYTTGTSLAVIGEIWIQD